MQVDIGLDRARHLGAWHLVAGVDLLAALDPLGFLARHIAFVEGDLAVRRHVDIDAPALALRSSDELVAREIFARRDDHDIAPSLVEIGLAALDRKSTRLNSSH